ncbi:19296_t:CDS:10 [Entrophospora sp. SA101]|nr:19296_t:CDS:10 [Entrophospora sp. SA101]
MTLLLLFQIVQSYDFEITYNDPDKRLGFMNTKQSADGIMVLRYARYHNDSSIIKSFIVDYPIPNYNLCPNDMIEYYILNKEYVLVTYVEEAPYDAGYAYDLYGLIVNINGKVTKKLKLGADYQHKIAVNLVPENGFIAIDRPINTSRSWQIFSHPDPITGDVQQISSGKLEFTDKVGNENINSAILSTAEGGYALISVTKINLTHSDDTYYEPKWSVYATFIKPELNIVPRPYLIYETAEILDSLEIQKCKIANNGIGNVCILHFRKTVIGGFLVTHLKKDAITGYLVDDDGKFVENWEGVKGTSVNMGVFYHNNTVYGIVQQKNKNEIKIYANFLKKSQAINPNFQNSVINSTFPEINSTTPLTTLSITYKIPVTLSTQNITVYKYPENGDDLSSMTNFRQTFSASAGLCNLSNDNYTVNITVFPSTFNEPGSRYFVVINDNFVKSQPENEPLLGISKFYWTFTLGSQKNYPISKEEATGLLCLTTEGTEVYQSYDDPDEFRRLLIEQLSSVIPISPSRLKLSSHTQIDSTAAKERVLFELTITLNNNKQEKDVETIIKDLNSLIANKDYTAISKHNITRYLDSEKQFVIIHNNISKKSNKICIYILSAFGGCFLALLIIYLIARNKNKEIKSNREFAKWFQKYSRIASVITILSSADVEMLEILDSKIFNLQVFSAPLSSQQRGLKHQSLFFYGGMMNLFIEDIPQFIIQIIYYLNTTTTDIIPFMALITNEHNNSSSSTDNNKGLSHNYSKFARILSIDNPELVKELIDEDDEDVKSLKTNLLTRELINLIMKYSKIQILDLDFVSCYYSSSLSNLLYGCFSNIKELKCSSNNQSELLKALINSTSKSIQILDINSIGYKDDNNDDLIVLLNSQNNKFFFLTHTTEYIIEMGNFITLNGKNLQTLCIAGLSDLPPATDAIKHLLSSIGENCKNLKHLSIIYDNSLDKQLLKILKSCDKLEVFSLHLIDNVLNFDKIIKVLCQASTKNLKFVSFQANGVNEFTMINPLLDFLQKNNKSRKDSLPTAPPFFLRFYIIGFNEDLMDKLAQIKELVDLDYNHHSFFRVSDVLFKHPYST